MRTFSLLLLAAVASPALSAPMATAHGDDLGLARTVVRARLAGIMGEEDEQATLLAEAARAVPGDPRLSLSALRSAVMAGDAGLAERALAALPAQAPRPPDVQLLELALAVRGGSAPAEDAALARIDRDPALHMVAPIVRAWIAFGRQAADPTAPLATVPGAVRNDADEAHALILLAGGRTTDALALLQPLLSPARPDASAREVRLRVAAALALARAGDKATALKLAAGLDPALALTRAAIADGRRLPDAIATPAVGIADMLDLLAAEIARGRPPALALSFAHIATFLAPDQARPWLLLASLQALSDAPSDGVRALDRVPPASAFMPAARPLRVRLLVRSGDLAAAVTAAQAATAARDATEDDWVALGEAQAAGDHQREAAAAFARARQVAKRAGASNMALWRYDLLEGGALEQAGDWKVAEPLLARAVALAPDQPDALNYLGYARIDRHEDVAAATKLIERAHALDPDNGAITDSLGWAQYRAGDLARAVPTLEHAAAAEPGDPEINEHLGDAYWAAGRFFEARYAWRAASVYADEAARARLLAKIADGPPAA